MPAGRAQDGSAEGVVGEPGELEGGSGEVIRAGSGTAAGGADTSADGNASSVRGRPLGFQGWTRRWGGLSEVGLKKQLKIKGKRNLLSLKLL